MRYRIANLGQDANIIASFRNQLKNYSRQAEYYREISKTDPDFIDAAEWYEELRDEAQAALTRAIQRISKGEEISYPQMTEPISYIPPTTGMPPPSPPPRRFSREDLVRRLVDVPSGYIPVGAESVELPPPGTPTPTLTPPPPPPVRPPVATPRTSKPISAPMEPRGPVMVESGFIPIGPTSVDRPAPPVPSVDTREPGALDITPSEQRPDIASTMCPPGQIWNGQECQWPGTMAPSTAASLISRAASLAPAATSAIQFGGMGRRFPVINL